MTGVQTCALPIYSLHKLSGFTQVYHSAAFKDPLTALGIHPDRALLALGTPTSKIQICDVCTGGVAATISPPESMAGPFTIDSLSFSENGYHLLAPNSLSSRVWRISAACDNPHSQRQPHGPWCANQTSTLVALSSLDRTHLLHELVTVAMHSMVHPPSLSAE